MLFDFCFCVLLKLNFSWNMAVAQANMFPSVNLELLVFQYNSVSDIRLRVYDAQLLWKMEMNPSLHILW